MFLETKVRFFHCQQKINILKSFSALTFHDIRHRLHPYSITFHRFVLSDNLKIRHHSSDTVLLKRYVSVNSSTKFLNYSINSTNKSHPYHRVILRINPNYFHIYKNNGFAVTLCGFFLFWPTSISNGFF